MIIQNLYNIILLIAAAVNITMAFSIFFNGGVYGRPLVFCVSLNFYFRLQNYMLKFNFGVKKHTMVSKKQESGVKIHTNLTPFLPVFAFFCNFVPRKRKKTRTAP